MRYAVTATTTAERGIRDKMKSKFCSRKSFEIFLVKLLIDFKKKLKGSFKNF